MMILFLIISAISILLYIIKINNEYWKRRGVLGPKPKVLVGNMGDSFFLKKTMFEIYADIYNKYQNPVVGIYKGSTPSLLVRDPDLIKEITIKSFSHFHDNDVIPITKERDPLFGRNPFILEGEEWKAIRSMLTPAFTSGKMKAIYPILENNSDEFVYFIGKNAESSLEAKDLCGRLTLNNVASCAFGLEGKGFEDDDSEFRQLAKRFLNPGSFQLFTLMLGMLFTFLLPVLFIKLVPKDVEDKLTNIIMQTMHYRKRNNIKRNDFLNMLQELRENVEGFTDIDVAAQASAFFVDGYETSSIVMSSVLYALANNPKVQEKLREEINEALLKNRNELSYEIIQSLPYLDATINEVLRLYPPIGFLTKKCTKEFIIPPQPNNNIEKPIKIEKDTPIFISIFGMHRDPKYFKEPLEFKPERFLEDDIPKYAFIPFGEGPRTCLGKRFGVFQIKMGLFHVIKHFQLKVSPKTKEPVEFNPMNPLMEVTGGLWIDFTKI